ncbi:hypothetical protein ABEY48_05920 [Bacillus mycoides]
MRVFIIQQETTETYRSHLTSTQRGKKNFNTKKGTIPYRGHI